MRKLLYQALTLIILSAIATSCGGSDDAAGPAIAEANLLGSWRNEQPDEETPQYTYITIYTFNADKSGNQKYTVDFGDGEVITTDYPFDWSLSGSSLTIDWEDPDEGTETATISINGNVLTMPFGGVSTEFIKQ